MKEKGKRKWIQNPAGVNSPRHVTHGNVCSAPCSSVLVKRVFLCEPLSIHNLNPLFLTPSFVLVPGFCCFLFCLFNFYVPLSFSIQMLKIIFIFFGTLPITYLRSGSSDITPRSGLPEYQKVSSVFIPVCHAMWFLKVDNKLSLVTKVY